MYYWKVFPSFNLLICLVCFYCEVLNYLVTRSDNTQHRNIHALNDIRIHYIHNTAFTIAIRFSLKCHRIKQTQYRIFLSFFLFMTSVYLLIAGVVVIVAPDHNHTHSHTLSYTHTRARARSVGLLQTSDWHVAQTST
jgi:hypothetical protein